METGTGHRGGARWNRAKTESKRERERERERERKRKGAGIETEESRGSRKKGPGLTGRETSRSNVDQQPQQPVAEHCYIARPLRSEHACPHTLVFVYISDRFCAELSRFSSVSESFQTSPRDCRGREFQNCLGISRLSTLELN